MSDPRYALVRVDDPDVTDVVVWPVITLDEDDRLFRDPVEVPVPPDDRLVRAISELARFAEVQYEHAIHGSQKEILREYKDAASLARAAFGLGEEALPPDVGAKAQKVMDDPGSGKVIDPSGARRHFRSVLDEGGDDE